MGKKIMVIDMTGKGCRHRQYGKQLNRAFVFRPTSEKVKNAILKGAFAAYEGRQAYFYRNKNVTWVKKVKEGEINKLRRPGAKAKSVPVDCTGLVTAICKYAGVSAVRCASYDTYMYALTLNGKLKKMAFHADSSSIKPGDIMVRKNGSRGHAWVYVGGASNPSSGNSANAKTTSATTKMGTGAQAFVATAKKEVGTKETGNNHVKYGKWFGMDGESWCAMFVAWCANKTFGNNKAIPKTSAMAHYLQEYTVTKCGGSWVLKGSFAKNEQNAAKCKPGDIFTTDPNHNGLADHVGIIEKVKGKTLYTIEGNAGPSTDRVVSGTRDISAIYRVARPKFPGGSYPIDGGGVVGEDGEAIMGVDSGGAIVLTTIDQLFSSEKYKWFEQEEVESEEEKARKAHNEELKSFLTNMSVNLSSGSSIIPTDVQVTGTNVVASSNFVFKPSLFSGKSGTASLTSYPSLVEAPYIELNFNGVTIGGYGNTGDKFPNYITSMSVQKINGKITYYTINLNYQIRPGEDPNFIDSLVSYTGYLNPLKIKYGDCSSPGLIFKEEDAVITDVKSNDSVSSSSISYTIQAISSVVSSNQSYFNFKEVTGKPSTVINDLLYNKGMISKQLTTAFPAMADRSYVTSNNLIPVNDAVVTIGGMTNTTPLTYLGHAVSCMTNDVKTSSYFLTYDNSPNGALFKVSEISGMTSTNVLYEVDVGYPGDNFVTNFQLCDNMYWPLVYEYNDKIPRWNYSIDNNGNVLSSKSNSLHSDNKFLTESIINSNWWKSLTEFPISAKLTLKGLTVPTMLMTYIRVNTLFYGQKDIASGVYVVTDQTDSISGSGYTTTLTLLRVGN